MSRAAQRAQTRQTLIDQARTLFRDRGYEDTTLSAVAKASGVAVGTVCLHFPTKRDLVAACFYEGLEAVIAQAWESCPRDGDPVDALLHLAGRLYAWYGADPALGRTLVRETMFLEGEWGDRFQDQVHTYIAGVVELLSAARDDDRLAPDTPVEVIAQGFFADYLLVLIGGLGGGLPGVERQLGALGALTRTRLEGFVP